MQWINRQDWTEVTWQRKMSDSELERHAKLLNERAASFGEKQQWDYYNDCKNALFIVRSEQRMRR